MIWLVLALVVAFALAESLVIERLWRDQRRTRQEFDELFDQVDTLAVAVDRQLLTQEQLQAQTKPAVAAIRESNQVVVETLDQLVGTIREAKSERRKLRDLIANSGTELVTAESLPTRNAAERPAPAAEVEPRNPPPLSWPETHDRLDIAAGARREGRARADVALAQRPRRPAPAKKQATG